MAQAEADSLVAIVDGAYKVVVAKAIVVYLYVRIFFYQIYLDIAVAHSPINMVCYIVSAPWTIRVMVYPIA